MVNHLFKLKGKVDQLLKKNKKKKYNIFYLYLMMNLGPKLLLLSLILMKKIFLDNIKTIFTH